MKKVFGRCPNQCFFILHLAIIAANAEKTINIRLLGSGTALTLLLAPRAPEEIEWRVTLEFTPRVNVVAWIETAETWELSPRINLSTSVSGVLNSAEPPPGQQGAPPVHSSS